MELIDIIKIVAIVALVTFIICSVFMMSAFRSVLTIIRDSLKTVDKFKGDLTNTMQKLEGDVLHLNSGLSTTLQSVDQTVKAVYDTVIDISDLKDRLVITLDNVDRLADSLTRNSGEVSDLKVKIDETVGNFNHLALQLNQTTDIIGKESIHIIQSFKPFIDALTFVEQKIRQPYGTISTYFSAAYKAVTTFTNYFSGHKGYHYIKRKLNDIPIYTKDVDEQVHGPWTYNDSDSSDYIPSEKFSSSPRASDDFMVTEPDNPDFVRYGRNISFEDSEGLLNNTYQQTEELLRQAELEIEGDNSKSEEERNQLKSEIANLREGLLRSVSDLKKEIAG